MASSTVRAPGRPARNKRDAPATGEGTPAPRLAARALHFTPPHRPGGGDGDRRLGLLLSFGFHVVLLAILLVTDAIRMPDLASLLAEPQAGSAGGRVVYMPIEQFDAARVSATPSAAPTESVPIRVPSSEDAARSTAPSPAAASPAPAAGAAPDAPRADAATDRSDGAGSGSGAVSGAGDDARDRFNRVIEALRPRALDPRLRPGSIDALRTDHERAALRAYARIRALNDSIMAEIAAGQRATDWTWTDEQGRRWGISPGKLHLGGITIPLPISTAPSREQRDLMREWQEIQAQAEQGAIDDTFEDRVEAIRDRRDAERAEP